MFNPVFNKEIGALVVRTRTAKGITQAELATKMGFSAQFLGRCEKGITPFPERSLRKVVRVLKINPGEIVVSAKGCAGQYATDLLS